MDVRVQFLGKNGKRLNSTVLKYDGNVYFFKQTGGITAEEQAVLNGFMQVVEVGKMYPIIPETEMLEMFDINTGVSKGIHSLDEVFVVNNKTRNVKLYKPNTKVNSIPAVNGNSMVYTEPLDLTLKTGMNVLIQEEPNENVD